VILLDSDARRTLGELVTLYKLEPTIRDVYVEGQSDVSFLQWYLGQKGISCIVKQVNTVYIPSSLVACSGQAVGNHGRLVTLAKSLTEQLPSESNLCVTCVADRDFDDAFGVFSGINCLLFTDYSSIEMYAFSFRPLDKFMRLVVRDETVDVLAMIDGLAAVLRCLAAVRIANIRLSWSMEWLEPNKYVNFVSGIISIEIDGFIHNYLGKNKKLSSKDQFYEMYNQIVQEMGSDHRRACRGHDFFALLRHLLNVRRIRLSILRDSFEFSRSLMACLELADLDQETLFINLRRRLT
jgi:hypothetical protein